jgi:integrase
MRTSQRARLRRAEPGVRRIRLHDVRHGYATLALKAGTHPKVVQQRLGHSSIMVTLDIYSHVLDELDDQAAVAGNGGIKL